MAKNTVPEAKEALNRFKMKAASEVVCDVVAQHFSCRDVVQAIVLD